MHIIDINASKNRLYLTLGKIENIQEMRDIIVKMTTIVKRLKHGFTCISDLREYSVPPSENEEFMQECQEILWDAGIGKAVRVSKSTTRLNHFKFEQNKVTWPGYIVENVQTIQEAEIILDGNAQSK